MKKSRYTVFRSTLSFLLVLMMLVSQFTFVSFADETDNTVYAMFSSDAHVGTDNESVVRFNAWVNGVSEKLGGVDFETVGFCGDLASNYAGNAENYWGLVQNLMDAADSNSHVKHSVFTTGNHEGVSGPGDYKDGTVYTEGPQERITRVGEPDYVYNTTGEYSVFAFGANTSKYQEFLDEDIFALDYFLSGCDPTKPVFILSHYPLHSTSSRSIKNTDYVIEVLNEYPNAVFLWGHNHTDSDPHYSRVYSGKLDSTAINFIYAGAGCMSDSEYSSGSHNTASKGIVAAIDGDGVDYTLSYYDINMECMNTWVVDIQNGTANLVREVELTPNEIEEGMKLSAVSSLTDGQKVVLSAEGYGLLPGVSHDGYTNSTNYSYYGLGGAEIDIRAGLLTAGMTEDMLLTVVKTAKGFAFKTVNEEENEVYLSAVYTSGKGGGISLVESADPQNDSAIAWTYDGSSFKHVGTSKFLTWENTGDVNGGFSAENPGSADFFSIRSTADPVTVFALMAEGEEEEEDVISVGDFVPVEKLKEGKQYILVSSGKALTETPHDGYHNTDNYRYIGLDGAALEAEVVKAADAQNYAVWTAVKAENGSWMFKDAEGNYLVGSYVKNVSYLDEEEVQKTYNAKGYVAVSTEAGENESAEWTLSGGKLTGHAGKQLCWDTTAANKLRSGSSSLFTMRSTGSSFVFYEMVENTDPIESDFSQSKRLVDGQWYVITADDMAMNCDEEDGYTNTDNYTYSGLGGTPIETAGGFITTRVTADMMWQVHRESTGYSFTNKDGLYLHASYGVKGNGGYIDASENCTLWRVSGGNLFATVENGKKVYFTWDSTSDAGALKSGSANFFTVHGSSADTVAFYQVADSVIKPTSGSFVKVSGAQLSDGDIAVLRLNDTAVLADLSAAAIAANGSKLAVEVPASAQWQIAQLGSGFSFRAADGMYLAADADGLCLSETAFEWHIDEYGLAAPSFGYVIILDGGFGVDPTATAIFSVYVHKDPEFITYISGENGSVSRTRELLVENYDVRGSKAAADLGYRFGWWSDAAGNTVSNNAKFVPATSEPATYYAYFVECDPVTINYVVKPVPRNGEIHGTVSITSESVRPVTGEPVGALATADEGYHFVNWTDAKGKVLSEIATYVPERASNGLYTAATYYANFEKNPECVGDRSSALVNGKLGLTLGTRSAGDYVFKHVSDGWTIQNETTGKYYALSGSSVVEQDEIYAWRYDGGFYGQSVNIGVLTGMTKGSSRYLTYNNNGFTTSSSAVDAFFIDHFAIMDHDASLVNNGNGTHSMKCKVCGKSETAAHEFDEDGKCACGAIEGSKALGVTSVNVRVATSTSRVFLFFTKTVYTAYITPISEDAAVAKVEYNLNGSGWKTGSNVSSDSRITNLQIRVTDENGTVTVWNYNGSEVIKA